MRVPCGEVAHRAYGVTASDGAVVAVEVENRSPVPLTIGLVSARRRAGRVEVDGTGGARRRLGRARALGGAAPLGDRGLDRRSRSWRAKRAKDRSSRSTVRVSSRCSSRCRTGRRCGPRSASAADRVSARALPAAEAVVRGWDAQLERGLRVELPPPVGERVDAARADLLLAPRDALVGRGARGLGLRRRSRRRLGAARMARSTASRPPRRRRQSVGGVCVRSTRRVNRRASWPRCAPCSCTNAARGSTCCPASRPTGSDSR